MHYISKYSLMLLIYTFTLALTFKVFGVSYIVLILTTLIYTILISKKIITFDSSWLERG